MKQITVKILILFSYLFIFSFLFCFIVSQGYAVYDFPFTNPDTRRILEKRNITKYLLKNDHFCNTETKMLVMVFSHVNDLGERMFVRRTWGQEKSNTTELKFIVGYKKSTFADLLKEEKRFKDIVMTNIFEEYYNLSIKTLAMFLLYQSNCPSARCLLKIDSDNVIDIPYFEKLCQQHSKEEEIHGYCLSNMKVLRRQTYSNKWDIPPYVYGNEIYPTYCRGGNYLTTGKNTVDKMLNGLDKFGFFESLNKQKMPEDVLFTGIAAEIANIPRINNTKIIPCINMGRECLQNQPLPTSWASATIGRENMNYYQSCSLSFNWKECVNML